MLMSLAENDGVDSEVLNFFWQEPRFCQSGCRRHVTLHGHFVVVEAPLFTAIHVRPIYTQEGSRDPLLQLNHSLMKWLG